MIHGQLNSNQLKELQDVLSNLELPQKKRQRLLWRIAKYGVIQAAKRNVRNQQSPRNKSKPDVKRTTPHPPARFGSKNYFSFKILQRERPDRASAGDVGNIAK
ncbi:hypothetical protein [Xenorhabdus littoralis]|uniref:hypothetical protein n=1 Tax=Xenorhabdus littoralis TaxID=2582835 RepID=UPI0029E7D781|nr:hypothetical protein [Xenorhabdus sp. Reich]